MGLRDTILAADDRGITVVDTTEWWGVKVGVRPPTVDARSEVLARHTDREGSVNMTEMQVEMVVLCACDPETGDPLFTDEDSEQLGQRSAPAVEAVFKVAAQLSGFMPDDDEDAVDAGKGD